MSYINTPGSKRPAVAPQDPAAAPPAPGSASFGERSAAIAEAHDAAAAPSGVPQIPLDPPPLGARNVTLVSGTREDEVPPAADLSAIAGPAEELAAVMDCLALKQDMTARCGALASRLQEALTRDPKHNRINEGHELFYQLEEVHKALQNGEPLPSHGVLPSYIEIMLDDPHITAQWDGHAQAWNAALQRVDLDLLRRCFL